MANRVGIYFVLAVIVFVVSGFIGGSIVPISLPGCSQNTMNLTELNTVCLLENSVGWAVKLIIIVLLTWFVATPLVITSANLRDRADLKAQMFTKDNNDTPAIFLVGILAWLVVVVFEVPFTVLPNYLANLAWRGSLSLIIMMIINTMILRLLGITSFSRLEEEISASGSNAVGWLNLIGVIISLVLI